MYTMHSENAAAQMRPSGSILHCQQRADNREKKDFCTGFAARAGRICTVAVTVTTAVAARGKTSSGSHHGRKIKIQQASTTTVVYRGHLPEVISAAWNRMGMMPAFTSECVQELSLKLSVNERKHSSSLWKLPLVSVCGRTWSAE